MEMIVALIQAEWEKEGEWEEWKESTHEFLPLFIFFYLLSFTIFSSASPQPNFCELLV